MARQDGVGMEQGKTSEQDGHARPPPVDRSKPPYRFVPRYCWLKHREVLAVVVNHQQGRGEQMFVNCLDKDARCNAVSCAFTHPDGEWPFCMRRGKGQWRWKLSRPFCALIAAVAIMAGSSAGHALAGPARESAHLTYAPEVPPPIKRKQPAIVEVRLNSSVKIMEIAPGVTYSFWTFNDHVPGPFIRARVGDVLEVHHTSSDPSGMPHNIDLHAVTGPGGGAKVTTVVQGEERVAWFKLLHPGLYVYHCAAPPVMDHIANGMYGLILVEPKNGLPKVEREFYVMQSEFYALDPPAGETTLAFSHETGLSEHPRFVVFNGRVGALVGEGALQAKTGERVRLYVGNGGPNLISSFHVIGEIFDRVYREADLISPPARSVQTTLVPAGGATVMEFGLEVPGSYTLVDHAIFRIEKGAVGFLEVDGTPQHDIYVSQDDPVPCKGCLVHP